MAIRVTSLDELSQDLVDQLFSEATQLMKERHPEVELTRGVFHDYLLYFGSVFNAIPETNLQKALDSRSLLAIQADPSLNEPELVDHVLSNFRVVRAEGEHSHGNITIIVDANETIVVPDQLEFEAGGIIFVADGAFTGRPAGTDLPSITDRELVPLGDGTYAFTIAATAKEDGPAGNIRRGTKMVPQAILPRLVTAYAANDFTDGFAAETNQQLLDKLERGVAAKSTSGRVNLQAFIQNQELMSRTLSYSIIGMSDAEMMRDQHWIFPMSGGGRVDIYARTHELAQSTTKQVTATFVSTDAGFGVWQFSLDKDSAPGFYEVERIVRPDAGAEDMGYEVVFDVRGYNLEDETGLPDIQSNEEGTFSKYQTAVIRFLDTDSSTINLVANESTAVYNVSVLAMPLIADLQDLLSSRDNRHRMADTHVKAAVPCFLSLHFTITKQPGEADPDVNAIAQALAARVNTLGFVAQLHSSTLQAVIHGYLTNLQAVSAIDMRGRIRRPDNTIAYVHSTSVLELPNDPSRMVTGRTVGLFLDPRDIGIDVITASANG